jgi:UDP-glucose 4-epimerase
VACEGLVEGFAAEYGVDGVSLRISRVYGPYRRANCHMGNIIRDAEAGRPTEIACAPDFAYHYVYAEDVAEAIAHVLDTPNLPSRAYNVNAARSYVMPELADIAGNTIAGADIRLVAGVDDVPDVQEAFDVSRIASEAGWQPRFGIAQGLLAYRDAIRSGRAA